MGVVFPSVPKIPQNSIFVRLNLGEIRQDLAREKGAKWSKLEAVALQLQKKRSLSKHRHRCLCISVRGLHSFTCVAFGCESTHLCAEVVVDLDGKKLVARGDLSKKFIDFSLQSRLLPR